MMGVEAIDMERALELLLTTQAKGTLLLLCVAAAGWALRRGPAAARHWVWFLGMAGLMLLPLLGPVAPRWSVPLPSWAAVIDGSTTSAGSPGERSAPSRMEAPAPRAEVSPPARREGGVEEASPALATEQATERAGAGLVAPALDSERLDAFPALPRTLVLALSAWAAGALLFLLSLAASLFAVARIARRSPAIPEGPVTELARRLQARVGVRREVRLVRGGTGEMPMSWGLFRPAILLPEGAERWHAGRLEAVLLHELAHVRRRDCLTQMFAEVVRALHWMNPLAWLAVRRLRIEREHACDDAVVAAGARPSEYAQELLSLARGFEPARGSALAAVAMARPVHLSRRLEAVLEERPVRTLSRGAAGIGAVVAASLVLALAAFTPGAAAPDSASEVSDRGAEPQATGSDALDAPRVQPERAGPGAAFEEASLPVPSRADPTALAALSAPQEASCGMAADGWRRMGHQVNDEVHTLTWERPGCAVEVRVEGDVDFTADFRDVASLGRNGLLRIEEDEDDTERRLDITAGTGGAPDYRYRVDGRDAPFDAQARAWYQGMLLQVFRRGGFMAEERVAALLRGGGVGAVLQEMEALSADHVFATYVRELLEQADLTEAQAVDAVNRATRRVDSDHYMSEILEALAERHLGSDRVLEAFISASRSLESDHYRAQVLTRALDRGALPATSVTGVLASAAEIESDHYLSELLRSVAGRYALEPSLREAYLQAVESIESDHYRSEVLATLLERNDLQPGELAVVLRATGGVESDHYRNEILARVAQRDLSSDELRGAYLQAAGDIESDHYRHEALTHLLERGELTDPHLREVIRAARGIEGDHYKSQLLLRIVEEYRLEGQTREAFLDALDTVESRHYRGQVAEALLRQR